MLINPSDNKRLTHDGLSCQIVKNHLANGFVTSNEHVVSSNWIGENVEVGSHLSFRKA